MKNKLFYLASLALTVISFAQAATTETPKVPEVPQIPEVVTAPNSDAASATHSDAAPATIEALPPVSLEGNPPASEAKASETHEKKHKAPGLSKKSKKIKKNKGAKVLHHAHHKGHHHKCKDFGGDITDRLNHEAAESAAAPVVATPVSSETPAQSDAAVSVTEVDIIQAN